MTPSCARSVLRSTLVGFVLAVAQFSSVQPTLADQTHTTADGTTNSAGQPVKASASFAVFPDRVVVRLRNQTPFLTSPEQALRGVSFRVRTNKPLVAHLGKSSARVRVVTAEGVRDLPRAMDVPWALTVEGNVVSIDAPGSRFGLLSDPPPQGQGGYINALESLADASNNPYLRGEMVMEVVFPGMPLTYDLVDVGFRWEHIISLQTVDRSLSSPVYSAPDVDLFPVERPNTWDPPGGPFVPGSTPPGSGEPPIGHTPPSPPVEDGRSGGDGVPKAPLATGVGSVPPPEGPDGGTEPPPPPGYVPPPEEIPEPGTLSILMAGVGWLVVRRNRGTCGRGAQ